MLLVVSHKHMKRSGTNVLISSLAVSDLLTSSVCCPMMVGMLISNLLIYSVHWHLGYSFTIPHYRLMTSCVWPYPISQKPDCTIDEASPDLTRVKWHQSFGFTYI